MEIYDDTIGLEIQFILVLLLINVNTRNVPFHLFMNSGLSWNQWFGFEIVVFYFHEQTVFFFFELI